MLKSWKVTGHGTTSGCPVLLRYVVVIKRFMIGNVGNGWAEFWTEHRYPRFSKRWTLGEMDANEAWM